MTATHRDPAQHNGPNVYNRQFSFLPTIMREIESQEMLVFLSIRPNNNTIPYGFIKTSVFKGGAGKLLSTGSQAVSGRVNQTDAITFFLFII